MALTQDFCFLYSWFLKLRMEGKYCVSGRVVVSEVVRVLCLSSDRKRY